MDFGASCVRRNGGRPSGYKPLESATKLNNVLDVIMDLQYVSPYGAPAAYFAVMAVGRLDGRDVTDMHDIHIFRNLGQN